MESDWNNSPNEKDRHDIRLVAQEIQEECETEARQMWASACTKVKCTLCGVTPSKWKRADWWHPTHTPNHLLHEQQHDTYAAPYDTEEDENRWSVRIHQDRTITICPNCMYGQWYMFTPKRWEVRRP